MLRLRTGTEINREPEVVMEQWADGRRYNDWSPAAVKKDVRMLTPEPIGPGSRFHGTFKGPGEMEYEIVEYDAPRRLAMRSVTSIGELRHTVLCEPAGGGTRLTQLGEGHLRGPWKLLTPLFRLIFTRSFRQNEQALKEYLERQPQMAAQVG